MLPTRKGCNEIDCWLSCSMEPTTVIVLPAAAPALPWGEALLVEPGLSPGTPRKGLLSPAPPAPPRPWPPPSPVLLKLKTHWKTSTVPVAAAAMAPPSPPARGVPPSPTVVARERAIEYIAERVSSVATVSTLAPASSLVVVEHTLQHMSRTRFDVQSASRSTLATIPPLSTIGRCFGIIGRVVSVPAGTSGTTIACVVVDEDAVVQRDVGGV